MYSTGTTTKGLHTGLGSVPHVHVQAYGSHSGEKKEDLWTIFSQGTATTLEHLIPTGSLVHTVKRPRPHHVKGRA